MNQQVHFGYVIFEEGTEREQVRVLVAASYEGLEAHARYFGLRLRCDDYVSNYFDLEEYDNEVIAEMEEIDNEVVA